MTIMNWLVSGGGMAVKISLILVFLAGGVFGQTPAENKINHSAERWVTICSAVVNADVGDDGVVHLPNSPDAGRCWGAFETLHSLTGMQEKGRAVLRICPSSEIMLPQWIAIFVNYVKQHPKVYDDDFARVAVAALVEAYPCKAK
jgi:hypothetical protein